MTRQLYLGLGALAGAYCRQHQCHIQRSEGIVTLSQKLGAKLGNCRQKGKFEEDNVSVKFYGLEHFNPSLSLMLTSSYSFDYGY